VVSQFENEALPTAPPANPPRTVYDALPMAPTPSLLCGCCASVLAPVALAARRGHGPSATQPPRGRHGAGAAHHAGQHQGVQGYSLPPPAVSPIRGLIDFHRHTAPDVFGRAVDDDGLAGLAAARQMETVVFKAVGDKHFVIGTDLGQTGNPTPADGLQMFVAALEAAGISRDQLQTMGRETPAALLMG
jgi:hypothetical protein